MGTFQSFNEVRTTEGIRVRTATFAFIGRGVLRTAAYDANVVHGINANHPNFLHSRVPMSTEVSGVFRKAVKIVKLKNTVGDWFSLRANGRTVYVAGDCTVIVEGFTLTLSEFYVKARPSA